MCAFMLFTCVCRSQLQDSWLAMSKKRYFSRGKRNPMLIWLALLVGICAACLESIVISLSMIAFDELFLWRHTVLVIKGWGWTRVMLHSLYTGIFCRCEVHSSAGLHSIVPDMYIANSMYIECSLQSVHPFDCSLQNVHPFSCTLPLASKEQLDKINTVITNLGGDALECTLLPAVKLDICPIATPVRNDTRPHGASPPTTRDEVDRIHYTT